jgi:hypothetical protein
MIHKIFSVHDSAAAAYLPPFFLPTEAMAIRTLTDCVHDENHAFSKNPTDYVLYCIGTFDDSTGIIVDSVTPEIIKTCNELTQGAKT